MTDGAGVLVDGATLTCPDVVRVAGQEAPVTVGPAVWERVRRAHDLAHAASATRPVYGRTTGVGANRDAVVRALRTAGTAPRGRILATAFAQVSARLPDIRPDHQLGEEVRLAEQLLDGLAAH